MAPNQNTQLGSFQDHYPSLWHNYDALEVFKKAADTFVKDLDGGVQIYAASRDWFLEEWGRDTFISLPGLLLTTERFAAARAIILHFAQYEKNGLIPNRIKEPHNIIYNTVDGPMWFIQAVKSYLKYTNDHNFVEELLPTIKNIIEGYKNGTGYDRYQTRQIIQMDQDDKLIGNPVQSTWMDADPANNGSTIVTPRNGKCVEINALWYSNLLFLGNYHAEYKKLAQQVQASFNEKFWNPSENCLYDVIEGDPHQGAIRPNMIFAVSHGGHLLTPQRQMQVFDAATKDLLTPGGLRTLSPRDSHYIGQYDTYKPIMEKDFAYHQGTVWPWLMGPYCDALAIVAKNQGQSDHQIRQKIEQIISPLVYFCQSSPFKSLPEVFSGDSPHQPGGTTSQAWSIAEVLRILLKYHLIE